MRTSHQLWLIYLVMAVYGGASSILDAAGSALLAVIVPTGQLAAGNSALHTMREGLRLIAPLVGAALYTWKGPTLVALIDAATFAASAASLAALRIREPRPRPTGDRMRAAVLAGLAHLRATAPLRQVVVASAALFGVVGFSETLIYAITGSGLHRPPTFVGVLLTAQGAGAILAGLSAAPVLRRRSEPAVATIAMAVFAGSALLSATPWLGTVVAGTALFGAGLAWLLIATGTLLQRSTPRHLQARVYAATDLVTNVPQIMSIALGAVLSTVLDYRVLLLSITAVATVAGTGLRLATRRSAPEPAPSTGARCQWAATAGDGAASCPRPDAKLTPSGCDRPIPSGCENCPPAVGWAAASTAEEFSCPSATT